MKDKNNLSAISTEKLIKRKKVLQGLLVGFGIVWLVMACLSFYLMLHKSKGASFVPMVALPLALLPAILQIKALNEELKAREAEGKS